ncbi:hypothetical protein [Nocardia neocaledoniensis]|uniref:hypothetical protein n=1 Tax=Nocardia neocaledoniensis TaxID=236511 RepID=UPI0024548688|nr:hypothetical protein [Nocardia neocaledoniensis]
MLPSRRDRNTDVDAVRRIVGLDWAGYTHGEKPGVILARLLDRIEEITDRTT